MNITQYSPLLADDLTVVIDGAETIHIYQPDSGALLTVPNCIAQTIKANTTPSESPQGATILEREWNVPVAQESSELRVASCENTQSATQTPLAPCVSPTATDIEPLRGSSGSASATQTSLATRTDRVGSQLEAGSAETGFFGGKTSSSCPCGFAPQLATINDIIIDSHDQQWRIVSIELKERIGRVVYKAQRVDLSPRLDEWVDIITPIYQTDENGAPYLQRYRVDLSGVSVRIIRVPVSSHRQLTDVPEERIEIVFNDTDLRISAHCRIRLADGSIYKPTDLFPITQTRPALRIIAQRES